LSELFAEPGKESSETNHKKFDEGRDQLTSDEKIATVRAVAEKASKIANRVTQVLAERRLLSEQKKSITEAPQGSIAEAPQKSAEAPQKSNETEQKDTGIPCLLSGPIPYDPATTVTGEWTDESVIISANLNTVSTCEGTISGVYFNQDADVACPAGCNLASAITSWATVGNPSSIGYRGISTASNLEAVSCETSDGTLVPPAIVTVTVQPRGIRNGQETLGSVNLYTLKPS
jgi:hypothetical protein